MNGSEKSFWQQLEQQKQRSPHIIDVLALFISPLATAMFIHWSYAKYASRPTSLHVSLSPSLSIFDASQSVRALVVLCRFLTRQTFTHTHTHNYFHPEMGYHRYTELGCVCVWWERWATRIDFASNNNALHMNEHTMEAQLMPILIFCVCATLEFRMA